MSPKKSTIAGLIVIVLVVFVLSPVWLPIAGMVRGMARIRKTERAMRDPKIYEPVAKALALYCQSDLSQFPEWPNGAWFPPELRQFGNGWGRYESDRAFIEFGGGFHHFGYRLDLDADRSSPTTHVWQLYLQSEDQPNQLLYTLTLPADAKLSAEDLLQKVIAGCDARIQQNGSDASAYQEKIQAYLRFNRVPEARATCREMIKAMPDDWWAALVNALILSEEHPSPDRGATLMTQWVARKETFSHYLDLAYFYYLTGRPREAGQAIIKATHFNAALPWEGDGGNTEYTGYTAAMCAYRVGDYEASAKLCAHLLPVTINGDYAKAGLRDLKAASEKALHGEVEDIRWDSHIGPFDAFEHVDIEKLLGHKVPRPTKKE